MAVLHIPSGTVAINGVGYLAAGAGVHPTVVICHGLPGNEKNLDLAQALRRAGWNAITFNYRGSWGSPGDYRFTQNPEDAKAVLAFLRDPDNARRYGIDRHRIALIGHSMGGWVAATVGGQDASLLGVGLISAANMGRSAAQDRAKVIGHMADDMESLAGVTAESMADEAIANSDAFDFLHQAKGLAAKPVLILSSDDGLAPQTDELAAAIRAQGGNRVRTVHVATDHGWSDRRIALQVAVILWLQSLPR
jgi:pimeloyl-ACP methyl ester carboxylesterase